MPEWLKLKRLKTSNDDKRMQQLELWWGCKLLWKIVWQRPSAVVHAYNPSPFLGQGRRITRSGVEDQPRQYVKTPSLLKIEKLAGHSGGPPCSPSSLGSWSRRITWTWKRRLQWAKITPLYSSLGDRARLFVSKKKICNIKYIYFLKGKLSQVKDIEKISVTRMLTP